MEMRDKTLWRCPGSGPAYEVKGTADALALFRLSGDPFNARALWLLKVVAVCQPGLF